uniref:Uncharacterized protein n=1 Tax=Fagus sylvatica TaxID=28930 RepID=A0A2N9FA83_FAGSY
MAISPRLYGLSGQDLGGGIGMDQAFDLGCQHVRECNMRQNIFPKAIRGVNNMEHLVAIKANGSSMILSYQPTNNLRNCSSSMPEDATIQNILEDFDDHEEEESGSMELAD